MGQMMPMRNDRESDGSWLADHEIRLGWEREAKRRTRVDVRDLQLSLVDTL